MNWKSQPFTVKHPFQYSIISEDGYLIGTTCNRELVEKVCDRLNAQGIQTRSELLKNKKAQMALCKVSMDAWMKPLKMSR